MGRWSRWIGVVGRGQIADRSFSLSLSFSLTHVHAMISASHLSSSALPSSIRSNPRKTHTQSTQQILTRVPQPPPSTLKSAVDAAQKAFESWGKSSLLSRQGVMLK